MEGTVKSRQNGRDLSPSLLQSFRMLGLPLQQKKLSRTCFLWFSELIFPKHTLTLTLFNGVRINYSLV